MAITKKCDRQELISALVEATYDDFDTTIIGTAGTSTMEAIQLPEKAIITGGSLIVDTAWNTGGVHATGVLTSSAAPADTNTVTIGATVYTFKTALSAGPAVAYEVLIGVSEATSLNNLAAAINAGAGVGTTYSTGTLVHPTVTAVSNGVHTVTVTAKTGGTAGNSIATTETHANATWGAVTLANGAAPADTVAVKIGSETYLTATSVDATGRTALVPTGTKLSAVDTVDLIWDVANTTVDVPTAGTLRLEVQYIVDGRASFSWK